MPKFSEWEAQLVTLTTDADGSALTVDNDAYTAGDVIGGLLSAAVNSRAGYVYVAWGQLVDDSNQDKDYYLHLFWDTPSTIADDAAFAPTEADKLKRWTTIKLEYGNQDGADTNVFGVKDTYTSEFMISPSLVKGKVYAYLEDIDASNPANTDDFTVQLCLMVA